MQASTGRRKIKKFDEFQVFTLFKWQYFSFFWDSSWFYRLSQYVGFHMCSFLQCENTRYYFNCFLSSALNPSFAKIRFRLEMFRRMNLSRNSSCRQVGHKIIHKNSSITREMRNVNPFFFAYLHNITLTPIFWGVYFCHMAFLFHLMAHLNSLVQF